MEENFIIGKLQPSQGWGKREYARVGRYFVLDKQTNATSIYLTEEELALFDKLKKQKLSEKEKNQIKKVAKNLLIKIKKDGINAVDWRKKQQIKARIRIGIEEQLSTLRPNPYSQSDYLKKTDVAFQHFYDNYYGDGMSVYTPNYNFFLNSA
mgnify:CR=1 FL=1